MNQNRLSSSFKAKIGTSTKVGLTKVGRYKGRAVQTSDVTKVGQYKQQTKKGLSLIPFPGCKDIGKNIFE